MSRVLWRVALVIVMVKRKAGRMAGQRYSPEDRARAVEIVRSSPHRTVKEVAVDLGINDKTLNEWVVNARRRRLDPDGTMSEAARRRLDQLEAENKRLQKELDFQKKAAAFISQLRANRNDSL